MSAFCAELQSQAAASQQNDGPAPTTDSTTSPDTTRIPPGGSTRADATYIIGADDVLAINVWKEPEIYAIDSGAVGRKNLVAAGWRRSSCGRTPMQLEEDIADELEGYITDPQVTVIVQQINSQKFNILGQIAKPGSFPLTAGTTIVDAIALAGGFRDFAKKKGVYLLRQNSAGSETRISTLTTITLLREKNTAQNIKL